MSFPALDSQLNENMGPPLPSLEHYDWKDEKQFINLVEILEQRKKSKIRQFDLLRQDYILFRERLAATESESMLTKQQLVLTRNDLEAREKQIKDLESICGKLQGGQEDYMRKMHKLTEELEQTEAQLEEKRRALNLATLEQHRNKTQMKERLEQEKGRLKRIFERVLEEKQAQLEREQCLTKEKMHLVREILTADNTDWGFFRDYWDAIYPTANPVTPNNGPSNQRGPGMPIGSRTSTATPETFSIPSSSKRPKLASDQGTFVKSTPTLAHQPPEDSENITNRDTRREVAAPRGYPMINPRHQRSLSTGTAKDITAVHDTQPNFDSGTAFSPKFKKKISLTNLKDIDANGLRSISKYALTTRMADEQGDIETRIYKGDIIPSAAGGAQVIFRDVEKMVQRSPSKV